MLLRLVPAATGCTAVRWRSPSTYRRRRNCEMTNAGQVLPGILRAWPEGVSALEFAEGECADPASPLFGVPESSLAAEDLPWPAAGTVGGWWNRAFDPEIDLIGADRAPVADVISAFS
jgi:hypothetical protein